MDDKTLYILDSYGLIYRAYYAFINRPLVNKNGQNISAIFGFFRNFHRILQDYKPNYVVAALDSLTPTFRHQMYEEYKATRAKTPEDLHQQIPIIEEILTALGVPVLRCNGYEADDIIATFAAECASTGRPCRILSGDKDLMQLVDDNCQMLKPDKAGGWQLVDTQGVIEEWGVKPCQMGDMLSLLGDTADNIPGVKGIGEKGALKLLTEYETLDNIYANIEKITGATGKKLAEGKEDAYFSKKLVKLCTDVPVENTIEDFCCTNPDYKAAADLLARYGAFAVAKSYAFSAGINLEESENPANASGASTANSASPAATGEPGDLFATNAENVSNPSANSASGKEQAANIDPVFASLTPNTGSYTAVTKIEELEKIIDDILQNQFCAFDCETDSLNPHRAHLAGFSLCHKTGTSYYVPLVSGESKSLLGADYISKTDALAQLERIFMCEKMTIVTHNGKYDYQVLRANGMAQPACRFYDTMIAAWLTNPERASYSLEALAASLLGLSCISFETLVPKQQAAKGMDFTDVPLDLALPYAAEDADLTLKLWNYLEEKLQAQKLFELFSSIEMPVMPLLAEMEIEGISLDKTALADYSVELKEQIADCQKQIFQIAGKEFNIASTKQLQEVLFVERSLPHGKKTKTGYSTDNAVLEELAANTADPLPKMILQFRGMTKLLSTYTEALPQLCDKDGRLRTSFIQTGTATGRLSSRDPNLQNIPVREEAGRKIRSAFKAKPGCVLISADYAQIELVVMAHLTGDKNLCAAFNNGIDVHKATAALIFGVSTDEVTPEMRRTAKTINFGVIYGMSAFRLANQLDIPRTKAKEFIDSYFAMYSAVNDFILQTVQNAESCGYVETIMGRRRYIRNILSRNKIEKSAAERIAVNTPIQGSAADIVKMAMLAVNKAIKAQNLKAKMLLQVHDELILECPAEEEETVKALLQKEMENVIKLNVPLRVSVEAGQNWGQFH